ncbi:MAG: hypothetical protein ACOC00_00025 [Halothiobacillaceae bacterium]
MITVNFYNAESYKHVNRIRRMGIWFISLWSGYVHVDIQHGDWIYAADMAAGKLIKVPASSWTRPAARIDIPIPDGTAKRVLDQTMQRRIGYGWLDFILYPFRRWIVCDAKGTICSESTAEILVSMAHALPYSQRGPWVWPLDKLEGVEHLMSPEDLWRALMVPGFHVRPNVDAKA